jgi:Nucleoside-diphosphate-sugar epimerases
MGFMNILEISSKIGIDHLVYASSSSVYGANTEMPFSESMPVSHPLSIYASTKISNEMMAHTYSYIHALPTTGLRFFTVYGPWGRPDMALFKFTKAILEGKPIDVFNNGNHKRDFTYIDDIVMGIVSAIDCPSINNQSWSGDHPDPSSSFSPYKIYNIGNGDSVSLMEFIKYIEKELGKEAEINFLPLQIGDVPETHANVSQISKSLGYSSSTSANIGVKKFIEWYKE